MPYEKAQELMKKYAYKAYIKLIEIELGIQHLVSFFLDNGLYLIFEQIWYANQQYYNRDKEYSCDFKYFFHLVIVVMKFWF